jgi:hypothetical protein
MRVCASVRRDKRNKSGGIELVDRFEAEDNARLTGAVEGKKRFAFCAESQSKSLQISLSFVSVSCRG